MRGSSAPRTTRAGSCPPPCRRSDAADPGRRRRARRRGDGGGKTGAFGVPVLQIVHESLRNAAVARVATRRSGTSRSRFRGLIPTTAAANVAIGASDRSDAACPLTGSARRHGTRDRGGGQGSVGVTSKHYYEVEVTTTAWCARVERDLPAHRRWGTDTLPGGTGTGKKRTAVCSRRSATAACTPKATSGCALDCDEGRISFQGRRSRGRRRRRRRIWKKAAKKRPDAGPRRIRAPGCSRRCASRAGAFCGSATNEATRSRTRPERVRGDRESRRRAMGRRRRRRRRR